MNKKVTALIICLTFFSCLILPASAQHSFVCDASGLLAAEEIIFLEEKAEEVTNTYGIHPVIVIVDSLGDVSPQDYADDYYDAAGYGEDGVLFLLAMEKRDWYISTCGTVMYALTDYGIQQIGEGVLPYFADGDWYGGFDCFLSQLHVYLDAYENGTPIDGYADYSQDYYHGDQEEILYYEEDSEPSFFLSLLFGAAVAGITVLIMRFSMNTKRSQHNASEYMKKDSWNLYNRSDLFLYSQVTKTRRQENSGSGSHGGGSSVHRSSSGRRHGGGGGKF